MQINNMFWHANILINYAEVPINNFFWKVILFVTLFLELQCIVKLLGALKKKKDRSLQITEDPAALYVTKSILHNNIRSFFNAKPKYKLLVNFVCNEHTMVVLISRRHAFGNYTFQMYNCNHNLDGYTGVIDAFKDFYPRNNLMRITTRTRSNSKGYCLAYTWCYMYDIYMGFEQWSDKKLHCWICLSRRRRIDLPQ